jgi:hypothetical protein
VLKKRWKRKGVHKIQIKVLQVKKEQKAVNMVRSLRLLSDARHDIPTIKPSNWLGKLPGLPSQVKLHILILHPHPGEMPGTWNLARAAVDILEENHGVTLDWACGYRANGAVWVLIKPWAVDIETGKRKWFYIVPEDLKDLRNALSVKRNKKTAKRKR